MRSFVLSEAVWQDDQGRESERALFSFRPKLWETAQLAPGAQFRERRFVVYDDAADYARNCPRALGARQALRAAALAKLTPEEVRALGIKADEG